MYELRFVLAFGTMDDPHIHWLQMACAIWGKNITSVFFRAVVSLGYTAHWSIKSKIFLFFAPIWGSPVAHEIPQKWLKSSMNWNLVGRFLLF